LIEHEVRQRRSVEWAQLRPTPALWWALSELDWRRWRNYQRSVWQRFDRIQVFSERDAEAVRALAPKLTGRVHVNPFGVDLPAPARTEREKEGILLFAGGFSHPPNVDAALWLGREIMPLIRQQRHNVHLLLVGSEPPQEVQSLACEDTIVTGRVPEIEAYVEQATVIVAPIRTGGGMRMKVLQGMALGKAVVTTQRGADGLLLDGAAAPLVVAESAAQFAAAVVDLLNDPPRRQALGRQARAFVVQQHSAAAYAGRLEAIYAEMRCADATESWSDQGNSYSAIEPVRGV
jgi:glycosyltransferase involved in cell wall biosynthesis